MPPRFLPPTTLLAVCLLLPAAAPADGPRYVGTRGEIHVRIPRASRPPVLDGAIDPAEWAEAAVLDSFTHYEPAEGIRDTAGTVCLVMYDPAHLYVAFRATDDPRRVQAPIVPRDEIWQGDWVGMSIDSYRDLQRSMFLAANARGIQMDGVDTETGDSDLAPDFLYTSKGRRTAGGFEVEMAVPFKTLRFRGGDSLTIGFNPIRDIKRNGVHMFFSPITRQKQGYHGQIGTLAGMTGVTPGRNLQVNPTFTGLREGAREGDGLDYATDTRAGLGLKYGVTSNLIADLAVTPDFSQIESDAGVVDINERFAIFFPEKRPFFLESRDLFATPFDLVYTRRIADPLYGAKLTGKAGRTGIGVLQAMDRRAGEPVATLPDALNPYLDRDARFDIVRLRQDVLKGSHLGVLLADRQQRDAWNRLAGVDGRLAFRQHWELQFQGVASATREPDLRDAIARLSPAQDSLLDPALRERRGRERDGNAYAIVLERGSRGADYELRYVDVARDFAADMGFLERNDYIEYGAEQTQHFWSRGPVWWQKLDWWTEYQRIDQHGAGRHYGGRVDDEFETGVELRFPNNTWLGAEYSRVFTRHAGTAFRDQDRFFFFAGSERFRRLRGGIEANLGENVVFEETVAGRYRNLSLWVDWRLSDQLDGGLTLNGSIVERAADRSRFADVLIPRARTSLQLTPALSLRWIAELRAERRFAPGGALASREHTLSNDLLGAYFVRPGTVLYLGYGALREGAAWEELRVTRNTAFLKVSYLFQT